jgi:hypothetical protein
MTPRPFCSPLTNLELLKFLKNSALKGAKFIGNSSLPINLRLTTGGVTEWRPVM